MKCFSGTCYGGPWHGKKIAHDKSTYTVQVIHYPPEGFRYPMSADEPPTEDYLHVTRGTYRYVGGEKAGAWHYDDR